MAQEHEESAPVPEPPSYTSDLNTESNWKPRERYLWVHKSTLACFHIAGPKLFLRAKPDTPKVMALRIDNPHDPENFHRCRIEVVRTKRECRDLDRRWAKKRKELAVHKAILGTKVNVTEFMKP